jgi:hypothetical protein
LFCELISHNFHPFRLRNDSYFLGLLGMVLRGFRTQHGASVEEGMTFLRTGTGAVREKARVLEVLEDRMGIPHVRFQLQVMCGAMENPTVENRTLALETFSARYKKST